MIALAVRVVILLFVGVGVLLLVGAPGALNGWLGVDLGFLLAPILLFVGLQLAALIVQRLHSERFAFIGWLVGVSGWVWLVFYVVDSLPSVSGHLSGSSALPSLMRDVLSSVAESLAYPRARALAFIVAGLAGLGLIRRGVRRTPLVGPAAVRVVLECLRSVLWFGVLLALLARGWLLDSVFGLDLSSLVPPIGAALFLRAAGRVIGVLRPGRRGDVVASLLGTISSVLVAGWVLYYLPTLAHRLGESRPFPDGLGGLTGFLDRIWHWSYAVGGVCLVADAGLRRVFALWDVAKAPRWIGLTAPAVRAALILVVGMVLRTLFHSLSSTWGPAEGLSQVVLWGTAAVVTSSLLAYFRDFQHPLVSGFARWASGSQAKSFILGGLIGTYFAFVRPVLFDAFHYASFLEWFIIAVVAWRLLVVVREESGRVYTWQVRELAYRRWRKHRQEIGAREDLELSSIQEVMRGFITEGIKGELVVLVVSALMARGIVRSSVADLAHRLVEYQDRPVPYLALPWQRRRTIQRNHEARRALLEETIRLLELPQDDLDEILTSQGALR